MSSAPTIVRQALVAALKAQPALADVALYETKPSAGVLPRIEVAEPAAIEWGTKDRRGRELRSAVIVRVAVGQRDRLDAMQAAAEAAGEGIARDLAGWRVASAVLLRARTQEEIDGARTLLVEHRIRVLEA